MTRTNMKKSGILLGSAALAVAIAGCPGPGANQGTGPTTLVTAGWKATFPTELKHVALKSAAAYDSGGITLQFDSSTPLNSLPNQTGAWSVQPNASDPFRGRVVFQDSVPGLAANPGNREQPFTRKEGTIAAVITVNQEMGDSRARVRVNVTGGPRGAGSTSRQGPMLRWNGANEYVTCFIDFATSELYLWVAHNAFQYDTVGKQRVAIDAKKSYHVEFEVRGQEGQCKALDEGKVLADTGRVALKIPARGSAGVMFELSQGKLDAPLEGSASEIESAAL
jgi:hypothetical protein